MSANNTVMTGSFREDSIKTREGVAVEAANRLLNKESVIKSVFTRAPNVLTFLCAGLKDRVYKNDKQLSIAILGGCCTFRVQCNSDSQGCQDQQPEVASIKRICHLL